MLWLDAFFRFSGVGLILMAATLALRDLPKTAPLILLLITQLCLLSLLLGYTPQALALPEQLSWLFRSLDAFLLGAVWLFVLSLFRSDFSVRWWQVMVALLLAGSMLLERMVAFKWIKGLPEWWAYLIFGLVFLVVSHMLATLLLGRKDDLLEKRRSSRIYLVLIIAAAIVLNVVLGSILLPQQQATINAISLFPTIVAMHYWLCSIEPAAFKFKTHVQPTSPALSHREIQLQKLLVQTMEVEHHYLKSNITIDSLAKHLGVGAPRLRMFINQHLGFNNFSTYINSFRIEAIKRAMNDPQNQQVPILTLAMNHGFNSLAPFNRAFKQSVGMTPSEFRKSLEIK